MIKKRLLDLLKEEKKYIYSQVIWKYLQFICRVLIIYMITGLLMDILSDSNRVYWGGMVNNYMLPISIMALIRFFAFKMEARDAFLASADIKKTLRKKVYEKLLSLGISYKKYISKAELTQISTEGVEQLEVYFGKYLSQLIYSISAPVVLFIILLRANVKSSIVLFVMVPLLPLSIFAVQTIANKLLGKYWEKYANLSDSFLNSVEGLTTLKIYSRDEERARVLDEEAEGFRKITMKVLIMQLNSIIVMDTFSYGGAAVGIAVALSEFFKGKTTLQGTLMIILLSAEFFLPLRKLGSYFHIALNGMVASDRIFRFLDIPEEEEKNADVDLNDLNFKITELSFTYDEGKSEALKNINLDFKSGTFLSVVGRSGCGKSTLAKILTGENKNYQGSIKIGNVELSDISSKRLAELFTYCTYNSYIFKGTIRENLLLGDTAATEVAMYEALQKVRLYDFVKRNKEGLDFKISEKASNLSGGQRQRLAIARALLHDTPFYIFDEAASNVDIESEECIMNAFKALCPQKTVIFISHRIKNTIDSDMIIMLRDGEVIETGTYKELDKPGYEFHDLAVQQLELESYGNGKRREREEKLDDSIELETMDESFEGGERHE